jgi:hypothetical protein
MSYEWLRLPAGKAESANCQLTIIVEAIAQLSPAGDLHPSFTRVCRFFPSPQAPLVPNLQIGMGVRESECV